jgi:hypothetical protein
MQAISAGAWLKEFASVADNLRCMTGHVLHLCNLDCHCLFQPLPSLSFSVQNSHSITRLPAPSPMSPRSAQMLSRLCCAHCGTFAAFTWGLNAFHSSVCRSGGTLGIASFCTFQRAKKHSNLTFLTFLCILRYI